MTKMIMVTASIACFALAQQIRAGVIWLASDDGTDLTLTTDGGSFNAGLTSSGGTGLIGSSFWFNDSSQVYYGAGTVNLQTAGTTGLDPWIAVSSTGTGSGHDFGYSATTLLWDTAFGATPGTFTPVTTMTFAGLTVATAFGTNLDAGAVTLWTHGTTGDTISVAKVVPEPSSMVMVSLSLAILMLRRRQGS